MPGRLDLRVSRMHPKKRRNNKARAKILIADGEGIFRLGLKKLFSVEDDLRVVAQAENSNQLVAMVRSFRPDLAIVQQELAFNGYDGLLAQIRRDSPNCKVVITGSRLTNAEEDKLSRDGISAMIPRSVQPEVFVENVRKVISGETIQPRRQEYVEGTGGGTGEHRTRPVDTLTSREKTIVSCLTQGWRNRDIAEHLTITEQTVKNHLRSIYDKVGVSDRLELVLYAIHQRLELPPVTSYT
jgi:DNA-binding NarL/FixJ family response regulator